MICCLDMAAPYCLAALRSSQEGIWAVSRGLLNRSLHSVGSLPVLPQGQDHRGVFGTVDGVLIPTQVAQAAGSQRQTVTRAQVCIISAP